MQSLYDLMVVWVRSSFVQDTNRLSVQRHEVPLEAEIVHVGQILTAIGVIVLEEQIDRSGRVPMSTVERDIGYIV